MNKKILITGGIGFIGNNLCKKLKSKGSYEITVLDNLSEQIHGQGSKEILLNWYYENDIKVFVSDIQDRNILKKAISGQDVIVHLAAETGTGQSMYNIKGYTDVNINGTSILLELLTDKSLHNVKKLIVASSRAVYGEGMYKCHEHGIMTPHTRNTEDMDKGQFEPKCPKCGTELKVIPTTEEAQINPMSIYGLTKFAQENMCRVIGESLNIPTIALRFQNVYGPGQSLKNPYTGILSIFSTRIQNLKNITIFEDGLESRDFVYISDVIESLILAIENKDVINDVFNIGSGVGTSVESITKLLVDEFDSSINYKISGNYRLGDIRHNIADYTKAKKILGFKPKVGITSGVKKFVEWVKLQQIEKDLFDQSIEEMKSKGLYK